MQIEFERFELPLRWSLPGSGERVRRGFYLKIDGHIGEAAPLPGWSRETLDEVEEELNLLVAGGTQIDCASARFAWECAMQEEAGWSEFPALTRQISINALGGNIDEALAAGCRCFKFKVAGNPREMAKFVQQQAAQIAGRASLRLDANRCWTLHEAREFLNGISGVQYQYLEEPLRDPAQLPELIRVGAKIAIDETLRQISPERLAEWPGLEAVILKPTLLGGLAISREFAVAATRLGAVSVVSASFESRVGLRALALFAASLSATPEPSGLDTARWFADEPEAPSCYLLDLP